MDKEIQCRVAACLMSDMTYQILCILLCVAILNADFTAQAEQKSAALIVTDANDEADATVEIEHDVKNPEIFIPTNEWQEIKPGQHIPTGLHIRLNLQTGKKEAKLMEENEDENKKTSHFLQSDIADSLNKISDDVLDPEIVQRAERAYKSIDQIKKDFRELKLNIKTDYEILEDIMLKLQQQNLTDTSKLQIFADLEYMVHQFDNALNFVKMDGIQLVIPALNSSKDELRASAAFLLGSAMQSNAKVQIAALEHALLMQLVRLIIWDPSINVQNRAMFALSCLIRQFPLAQQQFIEYGGLTGLSEMFRHGQNNIKLNTLRLKAITLLTDLMQEQKFAVENLTEGDKNSEEKLRQYKRVKLAQAVQEQGWCTLIPKHLSSPDHDEREKILHSMLTFAHNCPEFRQYESIILNLEMEYQELAKSEAQEIDDAGHYFTDLYQLIKKLQNLIIYQKDEL